MIQLIIRRKDMHRKFRSSPTEKRKRRRDSQFPLAYTGKHDNLNSRSHPRSDNGTHAQLVATLDSPLLELFDLPPQIDVADVPRLDDQEVRGRQDLERIYFTENVTWSARFRGTDSNEEGGIGMGEGGGSAGEGLAGMRREGDGGRERGRRTRPRNGLGLNLRGRRGTLLVHRRRRGIRASTLGEEC